MNNLYPYKPGSRSGKVLANALGIKRIKHKRSRFKPAAWKTVINWGSAELPVGLLACRILNIPQSVYVASDKLKAFKAMRDAGVRVPEFTQDMETAKQWLRDNTECVFCRTLLRANSGRGIVQAESPEQVVRAPLYVQYVKKASEWRVHVIGDQIVQTDRKVRAQEAEIKDWRVRNHDNGFIFQRNNDVVPEDVQLQALSAVRALDLDFGAVDVIWNEHRKEAYVLEVNTAPGMEGETVGNYVRGFKNNL